MDRQRKTEARRKAQGFCIDGDHLNTSKRVRCQACRDKYEAKRKARAFQRICTSCGKHPGAMVNGRQILLCGGCRETRLASLRKFQARQRQIHEEWKANGGESGTRTLGGSYTAMS